MAARGAEVHRVCVWLGTGVRKSSVSGRGQCPHPPMACLEGNQSPDAPSPPVGNPSPGGEVWLGWGHVFCHASGSAGPGTGVGNQAPWYVARPWLWAHCVSVSKGSQVPVAYCRRRKREWVQLTRNEGRNHGNPRTSPEPSVGVLRAWPFPRTLTVGSMHNFQTGGGTCRRRSGPADLCARCAAAAA